ncbi:phosphoenolpyruvate--protein phosphotransferase [Micropruina sp.]|uniref:phosphoenolpyruvate--protein phosphotransferase n=1 Tax=Micropruina sp. TaxID=2737536 RepID=UPI002607FF19|nr:phosphoenolpyruvate--protein phosphotransferase [Micropruina sp.]
MSDLHSTLSGIGVSAGVAVGPLVIVSPPPSPPAGEAAVTDAAAASAQVRDTLKAVADGYLAKAANADAHAKPILEAGAMMAGDPGLAGAIDTQLQSGTKGITTAVSAAVDEYCAMFESLGGYMAERVTDLRDVRDRTVARLLGQPEPGVPTLTEPSILAALDLAPAETATLSVDTCLGIITAAGGPTSHTAILAAQLGIPAIVQASGILDVDFGTTVALDGGVGEIIVDPSEAEQQALADRKARREKALAAGSGKGMTKDGHPVQLLANIGTADDARKAAAQDVEGSGLFRSEFLFLDRDTAPTVEEQTATYTEILEAFGDRKVVVRTLDAGADKPLAFADLGHEENPALGRRGIRLGAVRTDLLDDQLQALANAYKATGGQLWVMAPMIATRQEARWFAEKVRAVGLPRVGVMIEVPAAALRSFDVLSEVDFASLGTNDLGQYTMAADRMQGELAELLNPWQPALLDIIYYACDGGAKTGHPVGVCGESGGDPLMALVLAGLGVASLSMAPSKVRAVRTALALHDLPQCQQMAAAARASVGPKEAREVVLSMADPIMLDLM